MNRKQLYKEAFKKGYLAAKRKRLNESLPVLGAVKNGIKKVGSEVKSAVKRGVAKYTGTTDDQFDILITKELERVTPLAKKNGQIDFYAVVSNFGNDQNFVTGMKSFFKDNDVKVMKNGGFIYNIANEHLDNKVYDLIKRWFELNKDSIPDDNGDKLHTTNYLRNRKYLEKDYGEGAHEGSWSYDETNDERREIKVMSDSIVEKIIELAKA